jgi:predicted GTPase
MTDPKKDQDATPQTADLDATEDLTDEPPAVDWPILTQTPTPPADQRIRIGIVDPPIYLSDLDAGPPPDDEGDDEDDDEDDEGDGEEDAMNEDAYADIVAGADDLAQDEPADEGAPAAEAEPAPKEPVSKEAAPKEREPAPREDQVISVAPSLPAEGAVERLERALLSLAELAREEGMRTLASEITSERLPALQEGRVTVVVLGEFNHGKSSILNALLGEEVLPTGITPTTAVITHLRYADEPRALIQYDAQDRVTVPLSKLASVVTANQGVEPQFVEVGYPSEILRDNLVLVDTPGVNDISRQRVEITYGYVPRADVILYVLDANQVLKRSEITFIRDRLLRSSKDRLIFVLGKVDALSPEERVEVEDYAREKLGELLETVELYPVSARQAMKGQDEGFARFREHLLRYLKDRKAYILIDSGVSGGLRVTGMMQQNLAIKRSSYALDRAGLQKRVDAVHARLQDARRAIYENLDLIDETTGGLKAAIKHNLREFTRRFAEALPGEVERATVADIKAHLPDWVRDTFRAWLEEEGDGIARELERLAQEVIEATNASLREAVEHMQAEFGLDPKALDLEINTLTYDIGVYTLGVAGVSAALLGSVMIGGLFLLAAPLLALVIKDRVEERTRQMAREQGVAAIEQAGAGLEQELLRVIEEHGDKLKTFVESAGSRLYQQINEVLQQVVRETSGEDADHAALDRRAAGALARVDALSAELRAIRAALASA